MKWHGAARSPRVTLVAALTKRIDVHPDYPPGFSDVDRLADQGTALDETELELRGLERAAGRAGAPLAGSPPAASVPIGRDDTPRPGGTA